MQDLDLHLRTGSRTNVIMPIKNPRTTSYLMVIMMFRLSITISKTFTMELSMTFILSFRMGLGQNVTMQLESAHINSLFMAIVICIICLCDCLRDNHE